MLDSATNSLDALRKSGARNPGDGTDRFGDMKIGTKGAIADGGGGMAQRMMPVAGPGGAGATVVSAAELPDCRRAITSGSVRADVDGNFWVRTSAVTPGATGMIYDVIDRRGATIDRVRLPAGREVSASVLAEVVYMLASDAAGSWIERTHR